MYEVIANQTTQGYTMVVMDTLRIPFDDTIVDGEDLIFLLNKGQVVASFPYEDVDQKHVTEILEEIQLSPVQLAV